MHQAPFFLKVLNETLPPSLDSPPPPLELTLDRVFCIFCVSPPLTYFFRVHTPNTLSVSVSLLSISTCAVCWGVAVVGLWFRLNSTVLIPVADVENFLLRRKSIVPPVKRRHRCRWFRLGCVHAPVPDNVLRVGNQSVLCSSLVLFFPLVYRAVCVFCGLWSVRPFVAGCQETRFATEGSICLIGVRVGGVGQSCQAPSLDFVSTNWLLF